MRRLFRKSPQWRYLAGIFLVLLSVWGCHSSEDLSKYDFPLLTQDSTVVHFPQDLRGKILVVGYIYTHCPDVCPMITTNMKQLKAALPDSLPVAFVSISFDPRRDSPSVLKAYAAAYGIQDSSWVFLTGSPEIIDSLLTTVHVVTQRTYMTFDEQKRPRYFINHTDQLSLIDPTGKVVRHYPGSTVNLNTLKEDILALAREKN